YSVERSCQIDWISRLELYSGFSFHHNFIEASNTRCDDRRAASVGFQNDDREILVTFRRDNLDVCVANHLKNILARSKTEKLHRQSASPRLFLELVSQWTITQYLERESLDVPPRLEQRAHALFLA